MEILKQKTTYAIITLIKNYCEFPRRDDLLFTLVPLFRYEGGSKTRYYYTKEDLQGQKFLNVPFEVALKKTFSGGMDGEFFTTKEKHIKKYYNDPFSRILIVTTERTIKIVDGKVIARTYKRTRSRDLNCKYFKIRTSSEIISFNLNNGDINVGESSQRGKGVRLFRCRRNSFGIIENLIGSNQFFKSSSNMNKNSPIYGEYEKEMNDDVFLNTTLKEIGQYKNSPIKLIDNEDKLKLRNRLVDFLVEHKKIKTPNEYYNLMTRYYPGEVYLKKNRRKLIQSVLDSYGILSKLTTKIIHTHTDVDIKILALFCGFFGDDFSKYIGNLKTNAYVFFETPQLHGADPIKERKKLRKFDLRDFERENIIKITNKLVDSMGENNPLRAVSGIYGLFVDHMDMITQIREFDPNFKMRATNYDDFHIEHMELSKMIATIKKGWSTEYIYDNRMVRKVEEPINTLSGDSTKRTFVPYILKRDEEYTEEGSHMHHCVASYANKDSSIVISIRTDNNEDRVTCEFNKKTGECLQERHFCNRIPPEHFTEPLRLLRERVRRFSTQRLLNHLETKKVRVTINGKEVPIPQIREGGEVRDLLNDFSEF